MPPVVPGENCILLVCNLMKNQLKLNVQPTDISTAHRLGKKPTNQQVDSRKIIMKLCRREVKGDILNACRQIKPNLYINESLTPVRNTIMYILRRAKKKQHSKVVCCSSLGGRVYAYIKTSNPNQHGTRDRRIPVNTFSDLQTLCEEVLGEPWTSYIDRWPH